MGEWLNGRLHSIPLAVAGRLLVCSFLKPVASSL